MKELTSFPVEGLMDEIRQDRDPRKPRGLRHVLEVVLGIAVCAVLSRRKELPGTRGLGGGAAERRSEEVWQS